MSWFESVIDKFKAIIAAIILGYVAISVFTTLFPSLSQNIINVFKKESDVAAEECINLCNKEKLTGRNLTMGPCLASPLEKLPNWVCDVAHFPRIEIDNLPENQCESYRVGVAKRFVEVDENCKLIRIG